MGDQLRQVEGLGRPQHPAAEEVQPALGVHPCPAAEFVLRVACRLLDGEGVRLVDGPPAALGHQVREAEIVPEARIAFAVVVPAHGVDGAVAGGDAG